MRNESPTPATRKVPVEHRPAADDQAGPLGMQNNMFTIAGNPRSRRLTARRLAFSVVLLVLSALLTWNEYPRQVSMLGVGLGVLTVLSLAMRMGWVVPCTIGGVYLGMIMDAHVKGGAYESQRMETVSTIIFGTVIGFAIGLAVDMVNCSRDAQREHGGRAQSPTDDSTEAKPS